MEFSIGDYVIVSNKMSRIGSTHIEWVPFKLAKPQLGQVIGLAVRYDGDIEGGCVFGYDGDFESPYFIPTKAHLFWQVKFGLLNKPIYVREEDIQLASIDKIKELPKLYMSRCPYSDRDRKFLSDDSKDWPRDSKGRWTKGSK